MVFFLFSFCKNNIWFRFHHVRKKSKCKAKNNSYKQKHSECFVVVVLFCFVCFDFLIELYGTACVFNGFLFINGKSNCSRERRRAHILPSSAINANNLGRFNVIYRSTQPDCKLALREFPNLSRIQEICWPIEN